MILTAIVAVVGLTVLIGSVFWAGANPDTKRLRIRRRDEFKDAGPYGEISAGQGERPWEQIEHRHVPEGGHPHGKPASWALVAVVIAAFAGGGAALIEHAWWLLWTCAGLIVLAIPAGKMIGIMEDTVSWGSTPAATNDPAHTPEADPGRDHSVSRQQQAPPATTKTP